jgi:hypothetical protein
VVGTAEDRVRYCDAEVRAERYGFGLDRRGSDQQSLAASLRRFPLSRLPVQGRNIREKVAQFHAGVSRIVGCSGLFAGLAQGFIWALGSGSGLERVS